VLTRRVRSAFNRAAPRYDTVAHTQRAVVERLLDRTTERISATPSRILDAGCGTGSALPDFARRWPQSQVIALDLAEAMLSANRARQLPICGDLDRLPLRSDSIDLYWSSLALQWCDLGRSASEAARVLRPGGLLAVSTLSEFTFAELRSAFSGIDGYSHALELLSPEKVEALLRAAGLADIDTQRLLLTEHHRDFRSLLRQVKATGASEVSGRRRPGLLGRRAFAEAEARYEAFRNADGLPLRFDVLLILARCP
jgi:malonyl-CoA O-methyltransferase